MITILWGALGMCLLLAIAVLFSVDRKKIKIRTVAVALALQVGFAVLVLYVPWGQVVLEWLSDIVRAVIGQTAEGTEFLFGDFYDSDTAPFVLNVLPVIIFFASLTAILYHLKILQAVVRVIGGALQLLLGTSRAESMNTAANIFVGQTEAPLVIRPYVAGMTKSELFAVMVGGLSTVAGSVMMGLHAMGANLEYLIAACFMAAPGALLMAKILVPAGSFDEVDAGELERSNPEAMSADKTVLGGAKYTKAEKTEGSDDAAPSGAVATAEAPADDPSTPAEAAEQDDLLGEEEPPARNDEAYGTPDARNVIDAAARGASDGLRLALNVAAMLLAFVSLIALLNLFIGQIGGLFGYGDLTMEEIFGYVFAPLMWALGIPWEEATAAGSFLGQKIVLNEFVAFGSFLESAEEFSDKTHAMVTFALTGFANFSSLAILLGGLGTLVKNRRSEIAQLGMRAVLAGTLANLMSAAIVGMILV